MSRQQESGIKQEGQSRPGRQPETHPSVSQPDLPGTPKPGDLISVLYGQEKTSRLYGVVVDPQRPDVERFSPGTLVADGVVRNADGNLQYTGKQIVISPALLKRQTPNGG